MTDREVFKPAMFTVLVVDDDTAFCDGLIDILGDTGYTVLVAENGRQAEKLSDQADAVLVDYNLPDTDGISLITSLKEKKDGLISMIITGHSSEEKAILALKQGVDEYFVKPFRMDDLLRRLKALCGRSLLEKRLQKSSEALLLNEQRFRGMIENSRDGVFIVAVDKTVLYANHAACDLFHSSPEKLINTLFPYPLDIRANSEVVISLSDGQKVFTEMQVSMTDFDGNEAYLVEMRDITERKNMDATLRKNMQQIRAGLDGIIQAMAMAVEIRDPYTAGHQRSVASIARCIATELGLDVDKVNCIRMAGVVHDLGKLAIPAEILSKPTKLSDIEFALIKTHSEKGFDILRGVPFPWPLAEIICQHHERLDGSGYPKGLKDGAIFPEARIIAVADVVEAMSSHRPYRPSLGVDKALAEIKRGKGAQYDADAVDACLKVFEKDPNLLQKIHQN